MTHVSFIKNCQSTKKHTLVVATSVLFLSIMGSTAQAQGQADVRYNFDVPVKLRNINNDIGKIRVHCGLYKNNSVANHDELGLASRHIDMRSRKDYSGTIRLTLNIRPENGQPTPVTNYKCHLYAMPNNVPGLHMFSKKTNAMPEVIRTDPSKPAPIIIVRGDATTTNIRTKGMLVMQKAPPQQTAAPTTIAWCRIDGANLVEAYNRYSAHNFICEKQRRKNSRKITQYEQDSGITLKANSNGITCSFRQSSSLLQTNYKEYTALFFRSPLRSGWEVTAARSTTSIQVNTNRPDTGAIVRLYKRETSRKPVELTLREITIRKSGGSCNNINAVIQDAFGN